MKADNSPAVKEQFPPPPDELVEQVRTLLHHYQQSQPTKRRIVFIVADFYEDNNEVVGRLVDSCVRGDVPIKPAQVQWLKDKVASALNSLYPKE